MIRDRDALQACHLAEWTGVIVVAIGGDDRVRQRARFGDRGELLELMLVLSRMPRRAQPQGVREGTAKNRKSSHPAQSFDPSAR